MLKSVGVRFRNGHGGDKFDSEVYHYWLMDNDIAEKGDLVIVDIQHQSPALKGLQIAKVESVQDIASVKAKKFVVQVIDMKDYEERLTKAEKRRDALARLEQLAAEESRTEIYRRIATSNPEAAELLKLLD